MTVHEAIPDTVDKILLTFVCIGYGGFLFVGLYELAQCKDESPLLIVLVCIGFIAHCLLFAKEKLTK